MSQQRVSAGELLLHPDVELHPVVSTLRQTYFYKIQARTEENLPSRVLRFRDAGVSVLLVDLAIIAGARPSVDPLREISCSAQALCERYGEDIHRYVCILYNPVREDQLQLLSKVQLRCNAVTLLGSIEFLFSIDTEDCASLLHNMCESQITADPNGNHKASGHKGLEQLDDEARCIEGWIINTLCQVPGLTQHDAMVLQESGSLSSVILASAHQLAQCSIDAETATVVEELFQGRSTRALDLQARKQNTNHRRI